MDNNRLLDIITVSQVSGCFTMYSYTYHFLCYLLFLEYHIFLRSISFCLKINFKIYFVINVLLANSWFLSVCSCSWKKFSLLIEYWFEKYFPLAHWRYGVSIFWFPLSHMWRQLSSNHCTIRANLLHFGCS